VGERIRQPICIRKQSGHEANAACEQPGGSLRHKCPDFVRACSFHDTEVQA